MRDADPWGNTMIHETLDMEWWVTADKMAHCERVPCEKKWWVWLTLTQVIIYLLLCLQRVSEVCSHGVHIKAVIAHCRIYAGQKPGVPGNKVHSQEVDIVVPATGNVDEHTVLPPGSLLEYLHHQLRSLLALPTSRPFSFGCDAVLK